jgi:hypothetical protein
MIFKDFITELILMIIPAAWNGFQSRIVSKSGAATRESNRYIYIKRFAESLAGNFEAVTQITVCNSGLCTKYNDRKLG